ncbi:aliphatic sulfonate ABC transporter substrate-binding protein [Halorubrum gandharaense]
MKRRQFLRGAGAGVAGATLAGCVGDDVQSLTVDYAYYNPVSLVIREHGWLEEAFEGTDTEVEWLLSLGSNEANEYSQTGDAHVASTAGVAALMARSNGVPIRTPYIYSEPEWTALVTLEENGISSVEDLEGSQVAATRGTDPYFFLLQALDGVGLSEDDVEVVDLQHPEGQSSLVRGDVDAWAGLDPHMAELELEEDGAELFFRETNYNTYGFLNFLEEFLEDRPEDARTVIETYERGREWAIDNPEETAGILAAESDMSEPVAERVFTQRNDLSQPVPGDDHRDLLGDLAPILEREGLVAGDADPHGAVDELIDDGFASEVV